MNHLRAVPIDSGVTRAQRGRGDSAPYHLATEVQEVGVFQRTRRSQLKTMVRRRSVRLPRTERHRSGWPWVIAHLAQWDGAGGVLLDDFVERTFSLGAWGERKISGLHLHRVSPPPPLVWTEPWIGIFHHPPAIPEWFQDAGTAEEILSSDRFQQSLPYLRGGIALSEWLGDWLRDRLSIPVIVLKHPTEFPERHFDWAAFEVNQVKSLVQVGWFLRNYRGIYQVPVPDYITKVHLAQDQWFVHDAARRTDLNAEQRHRPDIGTVDVKHWLSSEAYDDLFTRNLVFLELLDASANNVVVEAIVRHTPIVVNRHPAVVEYLGCDYPLFFDEPEQVEDLLDLDNVKAAHEYLVSMDTSDLTIERFRSDVAQFAIDVARQSRVSDAPA
jgi:hypothetical protein